MGPRGGSAAIERPRGSPRHPHWSRRSGGARIAGDRSRTPRRRHRGRDRGGGDLRDVVLVGHSYGGIPRDRGGGSDSGTDRDGRLRGQRAALDGSPYIEMLPPPLREATERHVARGGRRLAAADADVGRARDGQRRRAAGTHRPDAAHDARTSDATTVRDLHPADRPAERGEDESPARPGLVQLPTRTGEGIHRERTPWFAELGGPQWSFVELPTSHWPMIFASETLLEPPSAPNSPRTRRRRGE
jgi:hypothetical protein